MVGIGLTGRANMTTASRVSTVVAKALIADATIVSDKQVLHRGNTYGTVVNREVRATIDGKPVTVEFWADWQSGAGDFARVWM
jgi:hypothetical protein